MTTNRTIQRNANLTTRNNKTSTMQAIIAYARAWSMIELVSCQWSVVAGRQILTPRLGSWAFVLVIALRKASVEKFKAQRPKS